LKYLKLRLRVRNKYHSYLDPFAKVEQHLLGSGDL